MALEIERRFLVSGEAWRAHAGCAQPLRQGYLAASAEGVTVRLRIKASKRQPIAVPYCSARLWNLSIMPRFFMMM